MKATKITEQVNKLLEEKPNWFTLEDIQSWIDEDPNWSNRKKEYTVLDIANADTPKKLNEASLGRVYQHFQNLKDGKSFAIMTSFRNAISKADRERNNSSFRQLKSDISRYGYFEVLGHGQEDDPVTGKEIVVVEPSLFIVNISLDDALKLAKKYGQYAIQYAGPETKGDVWLAYTNGGHENEGPFHPAKTAKYYSIVKGKKFVFESLIINEPWVEGLIAHKHGIKAVPGIRKYRDNK
jgi:hypothetical protein